MKIEIETNSSYEATVIIDEKKLRYGISRENGLTLWKYSGQEDDLEDSVGGMVAMKLAEILPTLLQGWMPEYFEGETWEKLPEDEANRIYEDLDL